VIVGLLEVIGDSVSALAIEQPTEIRKALVGSESICQDLAAKVAI
jgi:hypothetical protein